MPSKNNATATTLPKSKASTTVTKSTTRSAGSVVRTVGPAVPLAIALLGSAVMAGGTDGPAANLSTFNPAVSVKCEAEIADFRDCHENYPTGCTKNGSAYDPFLNELKNQIKFGSMPPSALVPKQIISSIAQLNQLEDQLKGIGLTQKNHAALSNQLAGFDEGSIYAVVGYLYAVEPEGAESSNCQLAKDPPDFQDVDYQIFVGFDPDVAANLRNGGPSPLHRSTNRWWSK